MSKRTTSKAKPATRKPAPKGNRKAKPPKTAPVVILNTGEGIGTERRKFGGPQPGAGRPTLYTTELGNQICERLADGETLIAICRDEGFPSERTVRTWALDPEHEFSPKYTRARELGYYRMADEMLEISDNGTNDWQQRQNSDGVPVRVFDHEHVQRSRLRFEARKWLLSKALPKIYGDKLSAELTGKDGKALMPEASSREIARAVLDLLRAANVEGEDAPQPADPDDVERWPEDDDDEIHEPPADTAAGEGAAASFSGCAAAHVPILRFDPVSGKLAKVTP